MSSAEFTEWMAFYQLEPFGPWRDDARIGVLGAGLAPLLGIYKGPRPTVEDFMPHFHDPADHPDHEDPALMYQKLAGITAAFGGTVYG